MHDIHIIGGGLAGSEAAWQLAEAGWKVRLSEMRGSGEGTPAHQTNSLAELVCSNSFRSDDAENNAVGLLHAEMRALGSLVLREADRHRVPAGSALAVDREGYAEGVTAAIAGHRNITLVRERVDTLPDGPAIVCTGPLTGAALAGKIADATGSDALAFFDAIAPIVHRDSIDFDVAWFQSRWNKGDEGIGDYINCPLDQEQYRAFRDGLLAGEKGEFREWERDTPYFDGCMPIEVMAERGLDTLRFGPMKPVGLDDPRTGRWPHAVVQLRQDNAAGTLWNIVGFQTKLKHAEQVRLFRTIPGLEQRRVRTAGRAAPQHLPARAGAARPHLAAEEPASVALRRADHRVRGLCRERRDRPDRWPFRRRRSRRHDIGPAASRNRAGRAARPHHRQRGRRQLPADERQLRPVPADPGPHQEGRSQEAPHHPRPRGDGGVARQPGARPAARPSLPSVSPRRRLTQGRLRPAGRSPVADNRRADALATACA